MEVNSQNQTSNCGFSGTNPKSAANPQHEITVFAHLPEKVGHYPPNDLEVHEILKVIREEGCRKQIDELRFLYDQDKNQYDKKKKDLPIIMFNGKFTKFSKDGLVSPSGLIVLDFDDIPSPEMHEVWDELISNKYVFSAFKSPSGYGYKALVKLDNNTDDNSHKEYFKALSSSPLFPTQYLDKSGSDISRCCFFSSDARLYLNENSKVWTQRTPIITVPTMPNPFLPPQCMDDDETARIINYLEGGWSKSFPMTTGNRHHSCYCRGRELAEWGISEDDALNYLLGFADTDFTKDEITRQVKDAYKNTTSAGKVGSKYRVL